MFYSHQLLSRKAPLGQIWRAATLHAKINRRNLNKLNIINICEEILNPSVPMALQLTGILMSGVVIVYQQKMKLLYGDSQFLTEDVNHLVEEINNAWTVRDPALLPEGNSQARYEAVTLPDKQDMQFSNSDTFIQMHMNLDKIDESYFSHSHGDADLSNDHHQANIEDITLSDQLDLHQTDKGPFNQYERFDVEGDDVTLEKFPSHDNTSDLQNTRVPSPPLQNKPSKGDGLEGDNVTLEKFPSHDNTFFFLTAFETTPNTRVSLPETGCQPSILILTLQASRPDSPT